MPMDKNSTQTTVISTIKNTASAPAQETIARIRQFARAYSFAPTGIRTLGNLILN